ncbi:MAG: hypothetical protein RXR31_04720 [Thermoproteota archaeon]
MGLQQRLQLIRFILDNKLKIINPRIESHSIKYDILEKVNIKESRILEELVSEGSLKRKVFATIVRCPACGSFFISSFYKCPYCGSLLIEHESIVTHNSCGYTGTYSTFKHDEKLVCPACKNETNKSEISIRANVYACKSCNRNFLEGKIIHYCSECGNKFEPETTLGSIETIYSYEMDDKCWEKVNRTYKPWIEIYDFLLELGFNVKDLSRIKGESGVEHDFDLIVEKGEKYIAFSYTSKITMEDMLKYYVKAVDIKNTSIFIVTDDVQDKYIDEARKKYGINIISLQESNIIKKLERQLKELKIIN